MQLHKQSAQRAYIKEQDGYLLVDLHHLGGGLGVDVMDLLLAFFKLV